MLTPILVTAIAGLATVIGAILINPNKTSKLEACSLAFAAGIMLTISLGDLLPQAMEAVGIPLGLLFLIIGATLSLILDVLFPHHHDHDEGHELEKEPGHYINVCECSHQHEISRGMIVALLLHNIIEGLATGVTVVSNTRLGINMAIGIALHNIPIGATLAVSVMSAGHNKSNAVLKSAIVGLAQPVGAFIGAVIFRGAISSSALSACMAIVAGILVFISFDEMWPAARSCGSRNLTIGALLVGICFIPLTEMLI